MTWNEQASSMMNVWTEAQKTMWDSWYGAIQNMANPGAFAGAGLFDQWQKLASQGLGNWNETAEPAARNVSRQLVASQAAIMRFLELSTRAWNVMMPKLEAGEDWQAVLNNYMEEFRKTMWNPAQMMQSAQGMTELWQAYMQNMQAFSQPWMKSFQQTPGLMGVSMAGEGAAPLIELTQLYWNAYDQTMGKVMSMPGVGFTRELEEKFAKGFAAWRKLIQAMDDYQMLIVEAWSGVYEQVLREMMDRAEQGKPVESVRDLVRLWTTAADKSFDKVFRTDTYAEAQGNFVTAFMEYRVQEQVISDELLKYSHIPTRGEVDEAHRNIYELRKEVKELKKALNLARKSSTAAKSSGSSSSSSSSSSGSKKSSSSSTAKKSSETSEASEGDTKGS